MNVESDVAIVGAGIVGLAHAWSAAKQGYSVVVYERDARAAGASIRNFGMVWPIGQTTGSAFECAMDSRRRWLEAIAEAGLWHDAHGSVFLASKEDEWAVCREFFELSRNNGYELELLNAAQTLERSPAARKEELIGSLASATELCVNPRQVIATLPLWLRECFGVRFEFNTAICQVCDGKLFATDGRSFRAGRTIVCGGDDLKSLFPDVLAFSGIKRCKLQMMCTSPQPNAWSIGPMVASGLTLRHYSAFEICPTLDTLKSRIATESPELDKYGIHVMASQHAGGQVVLGDSHEYGDDIEPFNKQLIDDLILRELRALIDLPTWNIEQRWSGTYGKLVGRESFVAQPQPEVFVFTATGGAGMTMSFGLAERFWSGGDVKMANEQVSTHAVPTNTN